MIFLKMFSRHWIVTTILVVAGSLVCVRLGIWQLDRLAQRRIFNSQVTSMHTQTALDLNVNQPQDISKMEWRAVQVKGKYDFANQIAVRNQYNGTEFGYHLIAPLLFDGEAVLVDRGWIPADGNSSPADWRQYDEVREVQVTGQIRLVEAAPIIGGVPDPTLTPDETRREFWNLIDLDQIATQIPYAILPVYIQQDPIAGDQTPPIPFQPELDLTEGPHFGYALQWFSFAAIMLFGYPVYLQKQLRSK